MNKRPYLLLFGVLLSVRGFAQTPAPGPSPAATPSAPPADAKADTLVDCGKEKAVIFGHTESLDGTYALGWTLHRNRAKKPVEWSTYDHTDPNAFIGKYPTKDDLSPGDYAFVNGVLDLRARRFIPLPTTSPYYPNKPDVELHVTWSDDQHGTRFALVGNDGPTRTFNLWLIEASPRRLRSEDLAPATGRAVDGFLRKQHIKNSADYHVRFSPASEAKPPARPFKGTVLEIPFQAEVPKADDLPRFSGTLTATLSRGKVTSIQGKKVEIP